MAIIKKPIRISLYYLTSFIGVILFLIIKFIAKDSQVNLFQLENKAKRIFPAGNLIPFAKADIPGVGPGDGRSGDGSCGGGSDGGDGDGGGGGGGSGSGSGS